MAGRTVVSDDEDEVEVEDEEREVGDAEAGDVDDREDDEDEEEEEDGQDEYEKDGFIVDDVDEEEEQDGEEEKESDEEEKHRKKKRKKRESEKNYVLDEDDYELLQDNNINVQRPKFGSNKFKRLKKASRDPEQEEPSGFSDEEEVGRGDRGRSAEEKLKRSLFGDDEGALLEDLAEEEEQPVEEEDEDIGEEDEMRDFIVDEDDIDENGAPVRRRKLSKKKSRQSRGISSAALQEAHDIFGDVDEILRRRKEGLKGDDAQRDLEDEFEPFIVSEKYMTRDDQQIRENDVPERIQLSEIVTGPVPTDNESIAEESTWIYNQLNSSDTSPFFSHRDLLGVVNKGDIENVLGFLHGHKYDIPFIATYRKELCISLLDEPDQVFSETEMRPKMKWHRKLWAVHNLDRKWLLLQKQKRALGIHYEKCFQEESRRIDHETRLNLNKDLYRSIIGSLEKAETEREVEDVDSKFSLHFPKGEIGVEEGQFKRPGRKTPYTSCKNLGLWEVAGKFGFSSEQFGLILTLEQMRLDELEDAKETPEEIAMNFTCRTFETPQEVLKGARFMAALEISKEPCVRKHVRSIFMEKAVVSTSPTSDGNTAIDSFHQCAGFKWLHNKPLCEFKDDQWLLIQKAEEEKLLQVSIKLPEESQSKLLDDFNEFYLSDGVSKSAQLWNEQRKLILNDALFKYLLPLMEKEARSLLTMRAKNFVRLEYGKKLWNKVSVAPYHPKDSEGNVDEEATARVMACCWGPGNPATAFVMLDSSGEVLDVLYAGSISLHSKNINDQQRRKNDQERLLKFLTDYQPQVVVVGAANLSCTRLKDDIFEEIFNFFEYHAKEINQDIDMINVFFGDESIPRLYENSRISSDQLPGQPGIVKRAVALGRYLQNPLAMIATLCGPGREILSWKLTSYDDFLTPDEKYVLIEEIMIDASNHVGVDVNLAASHEWLFSPLQFVSGLGPRKAYGLQRALVRTGAIFSRKEIPMSGVMKKKVFVNAVGFLRVRRSGLAATSSQLIDLLDDTRIHPESYDLAKNMAKDVYDEDVQEDQNDMDDEVQEMAIEHVREQPKLLRVLDVDEYAKSVAKRSDAPLKRETLFDIKMELLHGFKDGRTPYSEPTQDEVFSMISGETDETLAKGRLVHATVRRVQPERISCVLDSGLTGLINTKHLRDIDPEGLSEGTTLTLKIDRVHKDRFFVNLVHKDWVWRQSDGDNSQEPKKDFYYQERGSIVQSEKEKALKEKQLAKKHFKPRMIVHPRFQNLTSDEAIEFLSEKDVGESIIRPSSRGPSFLTLTLKVYDGVYAHKDIAEGDKDHKDITSLLRLGKTLRIGDDTFEDLDEVMDRYVDPLVAHLKNMLEYRKFKRGTKAELDEILKTEKSEYPSRIVYCIGISHEHPGTFILSYIRSTNPRHEYIGLYPKGFKFRKHWFDNIDRLVAYFQKHINDQPPWSESASTAAARVPMRSPATGGWNGPASNSGGRWRGSMHSDGDRSTPGSRGGRNDYRSGRGRGRGGSHNDRVDHDSGNDRQNSEFGRGWSNSGSGNGLKGRWDDGGNGDWSGGGGGNWSSGNRGGDSGGWGSSKPDTGSDGWAAAGGARDGSTGGNWGTGSKDGEGGGGWSTGDGGSGVGGGDGWGGGGGSATANSARGTPKGGDSSTSGLGAGNSVAAANSAWGPPKGGDSSAGGWGAGGSGSGGW